MPTSTPYAVLLRAFICEADARAREGIYREMIEIANRQKDRADEELDAKRVHGGKTLDEFLA